MTHRALIPLAAFLLYAALVACSRGTSPPGSATPRVAGDGGAIADAKSGSDDSESRDPARAAGDAGSASGSLLQESGRCFKDPTCPLARGAHLYAEAARAKAPEVECWRLYEGVGAPTNPALARTCLVREVARRGSGEQRTDLDVLVLARMMEDGAGGTTDREGARLLVPDAGALEGFRAEEAKVAAGTLRPFDLCDLQASEGWTHVDCLVRERVRSDFEVYAWERGVVADGGAEVAALAVAAREAWDALALKIGLWSADAYRGGTLSESQVHTVIAQMARERATAVAKGSPYRPVATDPAHEDALLASTVAQLAQSGDEAHRALFRALTPAWAAYRAAEGAFYARVLESPSMDASVAPRIEADLARAERARLEAIARSISGD